MSFASISSFLNSNDGRAPSSNGGWYLFDQGDLHENKVTENNINCQSPFSKVLFIPQHTHRQYTVRGNTDNNISKGAKN